MLTVKESEALRTQYAEVCRLLKEAKEGIQPASPKEKKAHKAYLATLQEKSGAMWEQLKDAPAPAVEPGNALNRIFEVFNGFKTAANKARTRFEEEAKTNLIYATQWYIADAIIGQAQVKALVWFDNLFWNDEMVTTDKLARFAEMYPEFIRRLQEEVLHNARGMASRSTSTASNFADDMANEGKAKLLYEFTESSPRWQINRALEGYNSWKELQNAE